MENLKVGDRVFVPPTLNSIWTGEGIVQDVFSNGMANLRMTTGRLVGRSGGFVITLLQPVPIMEILKIKRSTQSTGLKVYGTLRSDSGKDYNFAYIRRPNFRGWICSCESFFFTMFKKGRNCKHLHFVRAQVGRYGTKIS